MISVYADQAVTERGDECVKSDPMKVWRTEAASLEDRGEGSDAQGHVAEQPLLGAAAGAVSQGGDHLVFLRWHV